MYVSHNSCVGSNSPIFPWVAISFHSSPNIEFYTLKTSREPQDLRGLTYYSIDRTYIQKYFKEYGNAQNKYRDHRNAITYIYFKIL